MSSERSSEEETVLTEPGWPEARSAYGTYKEADDPRIKEYRQWWRNNPLNNVWTPKPQLWRRFEREASGMTPEQAAFGGANVTVEDLKRLPRQSGTLLDMGSEEGNSEEVWAGVPDPEIYAPGAQLTKEQLQEERRKGNVVTLHDLRAAMKGADGWELESARNMLLVEELQNTPAMSFEDGSMVSVWDLYLYTQHNPELKALAEKGINYIPTAEGASREERLASIPSWKLTPGETKMVLRPEEGKDLEWGLVATGEHWSRRPTRWLKGLDGKKDFDFAVYVHEGQAERLLGPKWAGRDPREVLADPEYGRDLVRLGPPLGWTLMVIPTRPLPIAQMQEGWIQRLSSILRTHAEPALPPPPPSLQPPPAQAPASPFAALTAPFANLFGKRSGSTPFAALTATPLALFAQSSSSGSGGSSSYSESEASTSSSEEEVAPQRRPAITPSKAAAAPSPPPAAQPATTAQPQPPVAPVVQQQRPPPLQKQQPAAAAALPPPPQQQPQQPQQQAPPPVQEAPQQAAPRVQRAAPTPAAAPQRALAAPAAPAFAVQEGPWAGALHDLDSLFNAERLAADTELVDSTGKLLRQGCKIILTAVENGKMLVQAVSPGTLREQRSYVLGAVQQPEVTAAILRLFTDPEVAVDRTFTQAFSERMLFYANGFKSGDEDRPFVRPVPEPSFRSKWELPKAGSMAPPPLVSNVRTYSMFAAMDAAFAEAVDAANAVSVPPGSTEREVAVARRAAAEAGLRRALGAMGLDAGDVSLPPPDEEAVLAAAPPDLRAAVGGIWGR